MTCGLDDPGLEPHLLLPQRPLKLCGLEIMTEADDFCLTCGES